MKKHLFLLNVFIVLFSLNSCWFLQKEERVYSDSYYFTYNAETILDDIKRGEEDILLPISVNEELEIIPLEDATLWSQSDIIKIIDYIFEYVWQDSREGWELDLLYVGTDCQKINGFLGGRFRFVKSIKTGDKKHESRFVRTVFIQSRDRSIVVLDEEHYPRMFSWNTFDLNKMKITAEQALQIAEENGGLENRLAVNNECFIWVDMELREKSIIPVVNIPLVKTYEWIVRYRSVSDNETIFRYWVEPK
jgi:hypothetical protein